jgi:AbrB family looped-hinge helix DNA binding protein
MARSRRATLRERGQLTIPAAVRKEARLEEGAVVEFEVREDGVLLRPKIAVDDLELDHEFVRDVIESTAAGYAELRGAEPAWAEELQERAALEGSLADGLEH